MARWENVLTESSRLLLNQTGVLYASADADDAPFPVIDDEGLDVRTLVHTRWHFPRALRWWTRRGENIQLAG